ncbi:MAG: pilus assembly protein [Burkholderiales bacterium]|nr:pilus assembly protein [Burkholderiales bacterium]
MRSPLRARMRGQAMVEFAIISLVLILLIAGGIELALAAFAGQRSSNAAEAAIGDWVYATGNAGSYGVYGADWEIVDSPYVDEDLEPTRPLPGLGDHAQAFDRPACDPDDASTYYDGLPIDSVSEAGNAVYLFNPRPIDLTDCVGMDGEDPSRSRSAALIDKLPALNRALYSSYQRRCGDADGNEVTCGNPAAVTQYLRLPGKLDPFTDTVGVGVLDSDPDSPGFQMPLDPLPRPTFEIECAEGGTTAFEECDSQDLPGNLCWRDDGGGVSTPLACEVRVRVRYRYVFHAFLQFPFVYWTDPLPPEALDQLDLGPGGQGGVTGSEVARGNVRRMQRTFLGCWETVTTAPTAGMQGKRTMRACN